MPLSQAPTDVAATALMSKPEDRILLLQLERAVEAIQDSLKDEELINECIGTFMDELIGPRFRRPRAARREARGPAPQPAGGGTAMTLPEGWEGPYTTAQAVTRLDELFDSWHRQWEVALAEGVVQGLDLDDPSLGDISDALGTERNTVQGVAERVAAIVRAGLHNLREVQS